MSIVAVDYVRRSTDKQETSIADQTQAIKDYAEEKGYRILRWYTDDAISGDNTEKRLGFQQMLVDAQEKADFKVILCWDQSRFGRFSPQEAGHWTYLFSKENVKLVTTDKGPIDWDEFVGWLTYSVDQHAKHQYLVNLSRDVVRGQLEAAKGGSWLGSPPYAYRIEGPKKNKQLVVDNVGKVKIVQRIFREFVDEGRAMLNIANRLNAEGVVSPGGRLKGWRFDTIKVILENPAYTGDYAGGRYSYGKYHTIKKGTVDKAEGRCRRKQDEWIVKQDHHEAIIDRITFAKAQSILAKGKTGRSPYTPESNPFLLSGLLRCGRCGCSMNGFSKGTRRYYECSQRAYNGKDPNRRGETCRGTTVREDIILLRIADHLDSEFLNLNGELSGEMLLERSRRKELTEADLPLAFAKVKKLVSPPKQPKHDRKRMERDAKTLAEQIDKARRNLALLDPENIPTVQDEIRRLQTEREQLEVELRKRPPSEADVNAEAERVLTSLYWLAIGFRLVALPPDWAEKEYERTGTNFFYMEGDFRPVVRPYLNRISGVTVYTRIEGRGTGVRHVFERGEIGIGVVGGDTSKVNPHLTA